MKKINPKILFLKVYLFALINSVLLGGIFFFFPNSHLKFKKKKKRLSTEGELRIPWECNLLLSLFGFQNRESHCHFLPQNSYELLGTGRKGHFVIVPQAHIPLPFLRDAPGHLGLWKNFTDLLDPGSLFSLVQVRPFAYFYKTPIY